MGEGRVRAGVRVEFESSSGLETRFVPLTAAHRSPRVTRALGRPPSATQPQPQPPRCTQTGILSQGTGAVLEFVRSYRPADIASGSQLAASQQMAASRSRLSDTIANSERHVGEWGELTPARTPEPTAGEADARADAAAAESPRNASPGTSASNEPPSTELPLRPSGAPPAPPSPRSTPPRSTPSASLWGVQPSTSPLPTASGGGGASGRRGERGADAFFD